jgi:hypothetical protein
MSEYANTWEVEIIFEPTGDYMNFTYETDEDDEDLVTKEVMHGLSVVLDRVSE